MISVEEALEIVSQYKKELGKEEIDLLQTPGRILAEDVIADRDFPPYHRVMMDGIAIQSTSFQNGNATFSIEAVQAAGDSLQSLQNQNYCIEVMTGALLPANTDAVIPYEDCDIKNGIATILIKQVKAGQNVHVQGTDAKKGERLLPAGTKIKTSHISILASVGLHKVSVLQLPSIAICSTGNELVDVHETPANFQIRRSNNYILAAALQKEGCVTTLFHLPDDPELMTNQFAEFQQLFDVVILSGAVSKGKFDFVPAALEKAGMKTLFHRVAQKPGKPMLFGVFNNGAVVFGLPGNPVSTLVCYHVYVQHWLQECLKIKPIITTVQLSEAVQFTPNLAYHLLVTVQSDNGKLLAKPIRGNNSGDLPGMIQANAMITLPPDKEQFEKGDIFELKSWLT